MFNEISYGPKVTCRAIYSSGIDEEIRNDEAFARFVDTCEKELDNFIKKINSKKTTLSDSGFSETDSRNVYARIYLPVTEINSRQAETLVAHLEQKYIKDSKMIGGDYFTLQECYVKVDPKKSVGIFTMLRAMFDLEIKDENFKKMYVLKTADWLVSPYI